jgi:hypothetical protein
MRCEHNVESALKRQRDGAPAGRTCDWVGACGEYASHLTTCPAVLVGCPLGCGARLARADADSHALSVCGRRNMTCPDCNATVKAANLAEHSDACLEKEVPYGWLAATPA